MSNISSQLVSVIIPVYNVENYLAECIESVINQTYKNLEILLIDDGSLDTSGKICDEFAQKDTRIQVIHKPNGGLSSARNSGLDIMRGDFVYLLDSDDYICLDLIERYLNWANINDADIVIGTYYIFWKTTHKKICPLKENDKIQNYTCVETLRMMLLDEKISHGPSALYKASLFYKLRYPIGYLYEDFATTYYIISQCHKVVICEDQRYFYRMRTGSIMNAKVSKQNMILLDIADTVTEDMIRLYPELKMPALRKKITTYMTMYSYILITGFNSFKPEQERIEKVIRSNARNFLSADCVRKKEKLKLKLFLKGKLIFYIACKIRFGMHRLKQLIA